MKYLFLLLLAQAAPANDSTMFNTQYVHPYVRTNGAVVQGYQRHEPSNNSYSNEMTPKPYRYEAPTNSQYRQIFNKNNEE